MVHQMLLMYTIFYYKFKTIFKKLFLECYWNAIQACHMRRERCNVALEISLHDQIIEKTLHTMVQYLDSIFDHF